MDAQFKVTCDHRIGIPQQSFTLVSCPRCLGMGFYNAFYYDTDGKVAPVVGVRKLAQQVQKILTEEKRNTGYGFDYTVMTGVINAGTFTAVKSEVLRCLQYLVAVQTQEALEGFHYLPTERIASVSSIDGYIDAVDPRTIVINASIVTVAGTTIDVIAPIRR